MRARRRWSCGRWLVLTLIVLGVVGQHCVLPTSGEAGPAHEHHEGAAGHGDHAIHAAPCDVIVAKTPSAGPVVPVVAPVVLDRGTNARLQPDILPIASPAVPRAGPPLYVLHASLLI